MSRVLFPVLGLALALAACSPTEMALYTGDYDTMSSLMRGAGAVSRSPDGSDAFRWVVPIDAYDGFVPKDDHEEVRLQMLSQWIGQQQICADGYEITGISEVSDMLIYEGRCH